VWLTDATKERGVGRLRFRANGKGGRFYYRYSMDGKQAQVLLGVYDSTGNAGLTLIADAGSPVNVIASCSTPLAPCVGA